MLKRRKDLLRPLVANLRVILAGTTGADGAWQRGDLDRELERLGIAPDGTAIPIDALPNPTAAERRARIAADAYLAAAVNGLKGAEAEQKRRAAREEFVERAAYTWINRLLALRTMEARGLIDEILRANPDYEGISEALFVLRQTDPARCAQSDGGWWAVIEDACTAQAAFLPGLFDLSDPSAALRPSTAAVLRCIMLVGGTPVGFTLEEADAAFADPDAIGWAYQFYQEAAKARVYEKLGSGGKAASRAEIAAATQLFTEPYMVQWLLQNSLGRSYHEAYPHSKLPESWAYYIRQRPEDQPAPESPRPLEALDLIDPCCGSGHFLREAFDMFAAMYREHHPNLSAAEVADRILERHLHGIDLDPRAAQLTAFTLYLRAWELVRDERRAQRQPGAGSYRPVAMNIATTPSGLNAGALQRHLRRHPQDRLLKPLLEGVFDALEQADILGSLLRPAEHIEAAMKALQQPHTIPMDFDADDAALRRTITTMARHDPAELKHLLLNRVAQSFAAESGSTDDVAAQLFGREAERGVRLLQLLDRKYAVVVTNPPYMGSKNMSSSLKLYIDTYYPLGKPDIYASFILRCLELCSMNGRIAMVTQQSWMFSSGFEKLRSERSNTASTHREGILRSAYFEYMAHLGPKSFTEITGEVVNSVLFIVQPKVSPLNKSACVIRVVEALDPESKAELLRAQPQWSRHEFVQSAVLEIPHAPLAYWLDRKFYDLLSARKTIDRLIGVYPGLKTGNDPRFLRFYWEVPMTVPGWFSYSKGGKGYGKWHGQNEYCADWRFGKQPYREYINSRQPYSDLYFQEGYTYSSASKGALSVRLMPPKSIFGSKGPGVFPGVHIWTIGVINSRLASYFIRSMSVGLDILVENVRAIPVPETDAETEKLLEKSVRLAQVFRTFEYSNTPTDRAFVSTDDRERFGANTLRLLVEGFIEHLVCQIYGLDHHLRAYPET